MCGACVLVTQGHRQRPNVMETISSLILAVAERADNVEPAWQLLDLSFTATKDNPKLQRSLVQAFLAACDPYRLALSIELREMTGAAHDRCV